MLSLPIEEKRNRVLLSLYYLHRTVSRHVDVYKLQELSNVGNDFHSILRYLGINGKGWLIKHNLRINITPLGEDKAEEIIKMQMAEKIRIILRKIYDLGGASHMEPVNFDLLKKELGMEERELNSIIAEFDKKGWTDMCNDESVCLSPAGVREVESPPSDSSGGGTSYTNIFQGPFQGGIQQGGSGNTQINAFNNNPKLDENVRLLVEVIRTSNLNQLDKDEYVHEVERIKQLAQQADTPGALERAQRKLEAVHTGLETVDKGGELIGKALPYITALWQLLTSLNS